MRELMLDYEIDHVTAELAREFTKQGFEEDEAIGDVRAAYSTLRLV